jgi:hypothetical protein
MRLTQRTELGTAVFNNVDIGNIAKKLCDIEDKIEQGKIVELPCAVGQTIYVITTDSPTRIEETKTSQVIVRFKGNSKPQYSILAPCVYDDWGKAKWSFCDNNFGTDFFFDRAEAEAKVREMEGAGE